MAKAVNVLVIGGTRFVGLHLVRQLVREGHRVTVINRGTTQADLPAQVERLRADRRDLAQMRATLKGRRFDAVMDVVLEQVVDAEVLIDALRGMGHYIMCSGTRIYAIGEAFPIKEDSPFEPHPPPESVGVLR